MNSIKLLEGVKLTQLKQLSDTRGSVLHMMRRDDPAFTIFGECYFSEILPGAVKAWKYHKRQTQNLCVPIGRILLVIFDNREKSSDNGAIKLIELGRPDSYYRITIPPRLWYGFKCISNTAALLANCADLPYDENESRQKSQNDKMIPFTW